jgi:C1A family cysteine protease
MRTIYLLLLLAILYTCTTSVVEAKHRHHDKVYKQMWKEWKEEHGMKFSKDLDKVRYFIFKQNVMMIDEHNSDKEKSKNYQMGTNRFTHMNFEEFHTMMMSKPAKRVLTDNELLDSFYENLEATSFGNIPESIDWREKGAVTLPKDQKNCGSCYSFSGIGALEGAYSIASGNLISLSEQQIVDCSQSFGNNGCDGGEMPFVFEYVIKNGGICSEQDYPYTAKQGQCNNACKKVVTISNYTEIPKNETALLVAVGTVGPVSIGIEADTVEFQHYSTGVFDAPCGDNLDHGVLAVGYGRSVDNQDYWIVKNSWGQTWGEQGYIRMIRGRNQCGISESASYPIV